MCGRYALFGPHSQLREQFHVTEFPDLFERYNIPPSTPISVVKPDRTIEIVRWGLKGNGTVANIRGDSAGKPWAKALLRSRCVIPASGFHEWRAPTVPKGRKQPFFMTPTAAPYLAIAATLGFWEEVGTAMFTAFPNEVMRPIHDHMPVLLNAAGIDAWLDPETAASTIIAAAPTSLNV